MIAQPIDALFDALRTALDEDAKHEDTEPHVIAAMKAALAIGEIVVVDLHRIADAMEAN
jgi:hypothetical protein